ncbi:MAG: S8 family serine peptidase [Candidatus Zixiibacteriota bacterium]|nr:MAG: S8 family serine peptidase [candidate division Zixibacteria bacterium]
MKTAPRITLRLLFAATVFSLTGFPDAVISQTTAFESEPHSLVREVRPVTDEVRRFLTERNADVARVWVFFTDKGLFTQAEFDAAAAAVTISDRALTRRAKVGRARVLMADLPVNDAYVRAATGHGGRLRRVSRWLNAASFDIPMTQLDVIADHDFVQAIKPVAAFEARPDVDLPQPDVPDYAPAVPGDLDYGMALAQLEQIKVPALHQRGLSGQGVTLAIFDTGYRKTHEVFAQHYVDGRVLAEYDFVFDDEETANEAEDAYSQWNHGTIVWSVAGGWLDGHLYGPAYGANFLLAKTEDVASETPVEEDNWVAALEWAEGLGADVVSSSLAYPDWYTYADLDGATAVITIAANTAAGLGIVVCNSMGNYGPDPGTLAPPADAFDMLAIGAVDALGNIAYFSSRGPTYDGRTKPEVCARGVSTSCATASGDATYGTASGTSLSAPLVAGAACLLIEAHPDYTPLMIRQAMMATGSQADAPDNDYGRGIVNAETAAACGDRGDTDFSGQIDIRDLVFLVGYIFEFTPVPTALQSADANADEVVDINDIIYMVEYFFQGGSPPPSP